MTVAGQRGLVAMVALLAASAAPAAAARDQRKPGTDRPPGELVVFAAASLKLVFEDLARSFEAARPGVKVSLSFAGSQELRTQIEHGARADLFASADLLHMAALAQAGLVGSPTVFARNDLVVVVPRDNPAGIKAFDHLGKSHRLIIGAPEVPIGNYTAQVIAAAGRRLGAGFRQALERNVVSRELNVRQVLAKVTLGEADAGIVYRTDAQAGGDRVAAVPIPAELNVFADYPIAQLAKSPHPDLAAAWVALLMSSTGQSRLRAAGFLPPPRTASALTAPAAKAH